MFILDVYGVASSGATGCSFMSYGALNKSSDFCGGTLQLSVDRRMDRASIYVCLKRSWQPACMMHSELCFNVISYVRIGFVELCVMSAVGRRRNARGVPSDSDAMVV